MLEVEIDKILPVTEARDNFNKIVDEVENSNSMYVITKNGKPSAVIVGKHHMEVLTGKTTADVSAIVENKADQTPVAEVLSSTTEPFTPPISVNDQPLTPEITATAPTNPPITSAPNNISGTPPPTSQNDDLFV